MPNQTILLAGIPRSGTTLVCALLNRLPNTLALVEPLDMSRMLAAGDEVGRNAFLRDWVVRTRRDATATGQVEGWVLPDGETNPYRAHEGGGRASVIRGRGQQKVEQPLDDAFTLVIKHPNAFTALIRELNARWPCFAIVRNPVSVLGSWSSLDHPLRQGNAPMAEAFDPLLRDRLDRESSVLGRQATLVHWYFQSFLDTLPLNRILRYEDVIASKGRVLAAMVPRAQCLDVDLSSRNSNRIYDQAVVVAAQDALRARSGAWEGVYSAEDLDAVLDG